jgi:hypothetical protein
LQSSYFGNSAATAFDVTVPGAAFRSAAISPGRKPRKRRPELSDAARDHRPPQGPKGTAGGRVHSDGGRHPAAAGRLCPGSLGPAIGRTVGVGAVATDGLQPLAHTVGDRGGAIPGMARYRDARVRGESKGNEWPANANDSVAWPSLIETQNALPLLFAGSPFDRGVCFRSRTKQIKAGVPLKSSTRGQVRVTPRKFWGGALRFAPRAIGPRRARRGWSGRGRDHQHFRLKVAARADHERD